MPSALLFTCFFFTRACDVASEVEVKELINIVKKLRKQVVSWIKSQNKDLFNIK
jgi:hypothetical protein